MVNDATAIALYIEANPGTTPQELAERLGVSIRTVRTYIHQVNDVIAPFAAIELARGEGYRIIIEDRAAWDKWTHAELSRSAGVPQSPQGRVNYLLNDLLMRNDWITIDDLCDILFISRSTATNDLKHVEQTLESFGLTLEKRPHYGIRVEGSEMARRLCLANIIIDAVDRSGCYQDAESKIELDDLIAQAKPSRGGSHRKRAPMRWRPSPAA